MGDRRARCVSCVRRMMSAHEIRAANIHPTDHDVPVHSRGSTNTRPDYRGSSTTARLGAGLRRLRERTDVVDNDRHALARHGHADLPLLRVDFDDLELVSDMQSLPPADVANGFDAERG